MSLSKLKHCSCRQPSPHAVQLILLIRLRGPKAQRDLQRHRCAGCVTRHNDCESHLAQANSLQGPAPAGLWRFICCCGTVPSKTLKHRGVQQKALHFK
eukprot:Skav230002  [mRNA]  locus=scaffold17:152149:155629:+ [translate_table: standard]